MNKFRPGELMQSEQEQKEFIKLYGAILKVTNILSSFDEFKDEELINERDKQDYHSIYIELYNEFRNRAKRDKVDVSEDVVFEMELIKSIEVNIDYILGLVKKYHESNMEDKEILVTIQKTIMASPDLRNKKDLIMAFIESLDQNSNVYSDFESFMNSKKKEELDNIANTYLNKWISYGFSDDTLLFIASNCFKSGKKSLQEMDELVEFLRSHGFIDLSSVSDYFDDIIKTDQFILKMLQTAGISRRPTAWDRENLNIWKSWNFTEEMILYASSLSAGKSSPIAYMNGILSNWKNNQIFTPENIVIS